jgi:hypothetical protein
MMQQLRAASPRTSGILPFLEEIPPQFFYLKSGYSDRIGRDANKAVNSIAPKESPSKAIGAYIMSAIFLIRPLRFCVLCVTIHRRTITIGHYTIHYLCISSVFGFAYSLVTFRGQL